MFCLYFTKLIKIKIHFPDEILVQDHGADSSAEMRIVH